MPIYDQTYICQINRIISIRKNEHQNALWKEKGALYPVSHEKITSHTIDFHSTLVPVITNIEHKARKIIREARDDKAAQQSEYRR